MGFRQELEQETVAALPLRDAIAVESGTVVRAAIALMRHHGLGCAVIVDFRQVPSGIFTEHSVIDALARGACLDDHPVCEFADRDFITVKASEPILRIWEAIQLAAARFVCVTDDDGKLIGLTGQRGLSEYLCDCFARQVTVQRLSGTPFIKQREGA